MAGGLAYEFTVVPWTDEHARNTEASTIELTGGRILLAWSEFGGGTSDISDARVSSLLSKDGGRTWEEKSTLVEQIPGTMNVFGPAFLRLKSGALALFYYHQVDEGDIKEYVRWSPDEGKTWTEEQCITPNTACQFMINDHAVQLGTGRIVLPMAWAETAADPQASYRSCCWFSDNEGATWQRGRGQVSLPKRGAMEPVVVERRDGSLLMSIRTQLGDQYRSESYDGGDTWTEARPMGVVGSEAPANIKRIPGTGDLLMVWNHIHDPSQPHLGRSVLTAAISRDDGDTWNEVRDLENEPGYTFAYPSILFREDEALLTYWRGKDRRYALKLRIVPVDWFYE